MATLSGNKIKDTYQSLVKFSDNGNITVGAKQLTDGFGNNSPMFVSTTQVGIGVTPESGLNLHVFGDAKIGSNLTVIGNLVVEGSTTTVGTDTLTVKDPLIVLANNNTSTDAVDIGFYGKYHPSGTTLYSGLFREALTGKYRLFKGLEVEPTTTVNTSGTGYTKADLVIGALEATTGTFSGNVDIDGTLDVDDVINIEGSAFGRIEIGGASGGYIDLKAPNSDDYDFRIITSSGGNEITTATGDLIFNTAETLALTIDTSQNATFEGQVTIPEIPIADTHAASKGYVDAAVEGQDTLAEILANENTTGGTDIAVSAGDDITFTDTSKSIYGTDGELEIHHNGTNSYITEDGTGALYLQGTYMYLTKSDGSQNYIELDLDGATDSRVKLNYGGATKLTTTSTGVSITGVISGLTDPSAAQDAATKNYVDTQVGANNELSEILANGNTTDGTDIAVSANDDITFATDSKAIFGNSSQLQIHYNDTTESNISSSGLLYLQSDDLRFNTTSAEVMASFTANGAVKLYYDASKKLETTSTGIDVTGDLAVDTDTLFVDASEDSVGIGLTNPADYSADELVISVPDDSGMTLVSGTTDTAYIAFADATSQLNNYIGFDHNTDTMSINNFNGNINFSTGEAEHQMAIASSGVTVEDDFRAGDLGDPYLLFSDVSAATVYVEGTLDAIDITVGDGHTIGDDADDNLLIKSSPAENIIIRSQNELFFKTNGDNERMSIDSTGIVKIGTGSLVTPSADADDLVIDRGAGVATGITLAAATSGQINFGTFTDNDKGQILYNGGTNYMAFRTNGSERMRITGVGNIGLGGNTNPQQKLDIANGGIQIQGAINTPASGQTGLFLDYSSGGARYRSRGNTTTRGTHTFYSQESDGGNEITPLVIDSSGNATFAGNVMPNAENLYDIGSASVRWEDIWADQVYGRSLYVDDNIYHNGDTDTYIAFRADRQTYLAGGDEFIDFREATESYITLGNSNDTDAKLIGGAGYIFIQGSNGYIGINDASPSYPFEVNANTFIGGTLETSGNSIFNGNVGIGTDSPIGNLNINGGTGDTTAQDTTLSLTRTSSTSNVLAAKLVLTAPSTYQQNLVFRIKTTASSAENPSYYSDVMTLNYAGNVGIGTTLPLSLSANTSSLSVNSTRTDLTGALFLKANDTSKVSLYWGTDGFVNEILSGSCLWYTGGSERMRITSGGNLDFNEHTGATIGYGFRLTSSSGYSQIYQEADTTSSRIIQRYYNPNGNVGNITISGSTTSYGTSSDYRLKENVVELTGALDRVSQLKPSRFNFIADADKTVDGFLAHEVQEIVPEAITGEKDGMRDEEYEVSPAVYEDVVHPAEEAVYETIEHPAVEEELDDEGNVIVEGKEAYTEEVLVTEAKEEWTEKVLVSEKVMGTREVPDYQGIDQSKLVPLLVGAIQELKAEIESLKSQINN